jgi:hypothetical protein
MFKCFHQQAVVLSTIQLLSQIDLTDTTNNGAVGKLGLPLAVKMNSSWNRIICLAAINLAVERTLSLLITPERDVPAVLAMLVDQVAIAQGISFQAQQTDSMTKATEATPELLCLENELKDAFRRSEALMSSVHRLMNVKK